MMVMIRSMGSLDVMLYIVKMNIDYLSSNLLEIKKASGLRIIACPILTIIYHLKYFGGLINVTSYWGNYSSDRFGKTC